MTWRHLPNSLGGEPATGSSVHDIGDGKPIVSYVVIRLDDCDEQLELILNWARYHDYWSGV